MPHKWKKKILDRETPPNSKILEAVKMIVDDNKSIRKVSEATKISKSALSRHVQKYKNAENKDGVIFQKNITCGMIFTKEHETMLSDYLITASKMHYGLTRVQVCSLAYLYAKALNLKYPESWNKNKSTGFGWYQGFMERHPELSLRSPEATSLGRATSFNKFNVNAFLNNLQSLYVRYKFGPERIYNCDETGITTAPNPPKVIAARGDKQVGQTTSAERGELVTLLFTVNALGNAVPPVFVFPRVRFKNYFLNGAPVGSLGLANKTGWMCRDLFPFALEHIIKHTNCSKDNPILLLLDNHDSHVSIDVINKARENGVCMLTFPPHCSHRLQPLDLSVFAPFKARYNAICNDWLINNPGKTITIYSVGELVGKAYVSSVTPKNIISGFKKPGIWPYNSEPFNDDDYLMSSVTDRPDPSSTECSSKEPTSECSIDIPVTDANVNSWPDTLTELFETSNENFASSDVINEKTPHTLPSIPLQLPSVKSTTPISPVDIRPYPKAEKCKLSKGGRKKGRTRILTDTPEKEAIEKEMDEKLRKMKRAKSENLIKTEKMFRNKKKTFDQLTKTSNYGQCSQILSSETDEDDPPVSICKNDFFIKEIDWSVDNVDIGVNDFVLVKFCTKKSILHYVGRVEAVDSGFGFDLQFMRKRDGNCIFYFPQQIDKGFVENTDVILKLPAPQIVGGTERAQAFFLFETDISAYNVQ